MMEDFISIDEMCKLTGYSKGHLSNLRMKESTFPFYRLGRNIFYKQSEIMYLLESSKIEIDTKKGKINE